jgi:serine/threonine protein kinase
MWQAVEGGDVTSYTAGTSEATVHSSVGPHRHLVTLLDAFEQRSPEGRHAVLVTEQLGDNCASILARFGGGAGMGLPLPAVQTIARQMLLGLEHLHKKRLVHRNVKPDNVLLDKPFVSITEVRKQRWGSIKL